MIIFNITVIVEDTVHDDFFHFLHNEYVPTVQNSEKFQEVKTYRLTEPVNEGITYCVQCFAKSREELDNFRDQKFIELSQALLQKFPDKAIFFTSVLEYSNPL